MNTLAGSKLNSRNPVKLLNSQHDNRRDVAAVYGQMASTLQVIAEIPASPSKHEIDGIRDTHIQRSVTGHENQPNSNVHWLVTAIDRCDACRADDHCGSDLNRSFVRTRRP
jgi:hypothetical protein